MLEQNYRSTQTILDAANAVIARNENRKPKKLWTALREGDKIVGYAADNAQQEAGWIANEIARIHNEEGVAYRDIAISVIEPTRNHARSKRLAISQPAVSARLAAPITNAGKLAGCVAYLQATSERQTM